MDKLYEFNKLPENVRQIGEQLEKERIYFEDYVITYMNRIFREKPEKAVVIYLGREGKGECSGSRFIYGAVELAFDITDSKEFFSADQWDELYGDMRTYFPESQILGWGVGIGMETGSLKQKIREIQKKHFPKEYQICYVSDQSEETQILYGFDGFQLRKRRGYMVYYGRNPQMQNYMLRGRQKESMEASYTDTVMTNVRAAIRKNEEKKQGRKVSLAAAGVFLMVLTAAGIGILLQSNRKLEKLEQTLAVVSDAELPLASPDPPGKESSPEPEKEEETSAEPWENIETTEPEKAGVTSDQSEKKTETAASEKASAAPEKKTETAASEKASAAPEKKTETAASEKASAAPEKKTETAASKKASAAPEKKTETAASKKASAKPEKKTKTETQTKKQQESSSQKKSAKKKPESKKTTVAVTQYSYVVQPGDTLSQIVWRQYRDLSKLPLVKERNHIPDENMIKEGQRIILPVY